MARLSILLAPVVLAVSSPVYANNVARWASHIGEASARFGVPSVWIERVMRAESSGRPQAVSRAGAMGLMQLMPGTWAEMRTELGLGPDPYEPRDNIFAGTAYLKKMHDRFGYPGLFAAYNAGPKRYADHLAGTRGLPQETRAYLASVAGEKEARTVPTVPDASRSAIFFQLNQHR